jgi:hypothetical protein
MADDINVKKTLGTMGPESLGRVTYYIKPGYAIMCRQDMSQQSCVSTSEFPTRVRMPEVQYKWHLITFQ